MKKNNTDDTYEQEKRRRNMNTLFVLVIILAVMVFSLFGQNNATSFTWTDDGLSMTTSNDTVYSIHFDNIQQIELVTSPDYGTCVSGNDGFRQDYGTWENDLWGTYQMCVTSSAKEAIVLTLADGVFVFNYESNQTTEALYDYLLELIAAE